MSVESISLVLNHSKAKGTAKVILLGIANHDGDGGAWPSVKTLARYGHCSERSVQYAIEKLVALGELRVAYNEGGNPANTNRPNLYFITVAPR